MIIKKASDIRSSEITPKDLYLRRREFIQAGTAALIAAGCSTSDGLLMAQGGGLAKLPNVKKDPAYSRALDAKGAPEAVNSYEQVTSHNNFYEFEPGAGDGPKNRAKNSNFKPRPWTISIEGEVAKPGPLNIEDLLKFQLEERVYRMRCVEGWSLVVPWVGFKLSDLIKQVQPTSKAKYVQFTTLFDPKQFPMQSDDRVLDWPYVEGLRMDEAMHDLTILSVGLYGEVLPAQNGAPIRLIVPWKYGFKGGKSIAKIRFQEAQPKNTWQVMQPQEYGFYANVNPNVTHPRWTQAREARLPSLFKTYPTRMFNGYDQVASLYAGMDLKRNY
jgi:sulfoxide reductase catalytic subunit YedY